NRLVRKGAQEIDLRLGERSGLNAADSNRSDRFAVPQHRDDQQTPQTASLPRPLERVRLVVEQIPDLHDCTPCDRPPCCATVPTSQRVQRADRLVALWMGAV